MPTGFTKPAGQNKRPWAPYATQAKGRSYTRPQEGEERREEQEGSARRRIYPCTHALLVPLACPSAPQASTMGSKGQKGTKAGGQGVGRAGGGGDSVLR